MNTESEWFQQVTAYTECLYEYRESADFMTSIDLDDLILPKNFDTLTKELNAVADLYPMAASFEFLWAWVKSKGCKY